MIIVGTKFGQLATLEGVTFRLTQPGEGGKVRRKPYYKCRCDCGKKLYVREDHLLNGTTKTCGCVKKKRRTRTIHGMTNTRSYSAWHNMLQRCENPKHEKHSRYGGRGIKVCERWQSFPNFLEDMGECPTITGSIDRIDNNGDYTPENCRWATYKQQNNNRSDNCNFTYNGKTQSIQAWSEEYGINHQTLYNRLMTLGFSVEEALSAPTDKRGGAAVRDRPMYTYNGETRCLKEWAGILGINYQTLFKRISSNWPIEKAFAAPTDAKKSTMRAK